MYISIYIYVHSIHVQKEIHAIHIFAQSHPSLLSASPGGDPGTLLNVRREWWGAKNPLHSLWMIGDKTTSLRKKCGSKTMHAIFFFTWGLYMYIYIYTWYITAADMSTRVYSPVIPARVAIPRQNKWHGSQKVGQYRQLWHGFLHCCYSCPTNLHSLFFFSFLISGA